MNASSIAMQAPSTVSTEPGTPRDAEIEAVRYAVLRKLAPGLRHALMGELQAIQLSAELASRMLRVNTDLDKIRETVGHLPDQCNTAVKTCRAVIEWLRPEDDLTVAIGAGVRHCLKLAGDDWFLRGIEIVREPPLLDIEVAKAPLQELVVTTLLVLADLLDGPMDIDVDAELVGNHVDVTIGARISERTVAFPPTSPYRSLTWADLELMAAVHHIAYAVVGDRVTLRFPALQAAAATTRD